MTTQPETPARRASSLSQEAHHLYRALIDEVIATGRVTAPEPSPALDELRQNDWLVVDEQGEISVLYPFSLSPTSVAVQFDGHERFAMCATDALGLAPMLATGVRIDTTCPQTGEALQVDVSPKGTISSTLPGVVVMRRRQQGAAHLSRCGATRFFSSGTAAEEWRAQHGAPGDVVLSLAEAYQEAETMFGRCYSDGVRVWI